MLFWRGMFGVTTRTGGVNTERGARAAPATPWSLAAAHHAKQSPEQRDLLPTVLPNNHFGEGVLLFTMVAHARDAVVSATATSKPQRPVCSAPPRGIAADAMEKVFLISHT